MGYTPPGAGRSRQAPAGGSIEAVDVEDPDIEGREAEHGSPALLEVRELTYRYPGADVAAAAAVSFAVRPGEIFGLLGPNGAGKTTTVSCIAGLRRAASGGLRFRGRPFDPARSPADRSRLGLVPQEIALYAALTARENLEFFGALSGLRDAALARAVEDGLALAGLVDRAGDRVGQFSGGMKRRLNLAAGQLHAPELLLLDEPTAGVDPQSRHHLFASLAALRDRGKTILLTTHSMDEAQRLCDRIAILDHGRVVAAGNHAELCAAAGLEDGSLEEVFLELTGRALRDRA
jgi:ABC-2 type transport system ATP-binding protein